MSFGIPSISSKQVIDNFDAIKSDSLPVYKNEDELIKLILNLSGIFSDGHIWNQKCTLCTSSSNCHK